MRLLVGWLWVVLFALITVDVRAQNIETEECTYSIMGSVRDLESDEPIPFASIQIVDTKIGVVADINGFFEIADLCDKEFNIIVSHLGYKRLTHHHDAAHKSPVIYLASDDVVLESIVVEGNGEPGELNSVSKTSLSTKEFQLSQSESFGNLASQITGVNVISTGQNIVKPVIHGLHSNRILIINSGLRHEFQNWGTDHAPEIDPSLYDDLEVIKGASSVRYGPDALGGVILINPAPIELSSHLHGKVQASGRSNGRSGEGTVRLQKGFKHVGVMAETSWLKQGDLRAPDYFLTNTGKVEKSYAGGIRIHPTDAIDINVYYSHFDQELGVLRGGVNGNLDDLIQAINSDVPNDTGPFSYNITTPKQRISHDLFRIRSSYVDEKQSLTFQYGRQFNHRREFDVRRGNLNETPNINLELVTNTVDLDWQHPEIGSLAGKIGFQWLGQENTNIPGTNTTPFMPNYLGNRFGFFVVESLEVGKITYEAGIRYDHQEFEIAGRDQQQDVFRNVISYDNFTGTVGLKSKLNSNEVFRTNIGTSWRPPNMAELYRFGRHLTFIEYGIWRYDFTEDGQITTANVLTENDRPVPSEMGVKWVNSYEINKQSFSFEATGYLNYINNFIFSRPAGITRTVRGAAPYFIYEQGDALFWGIDLSTSIAHSKRINSQINASYLWSKEIDRGDNFVGQPPPNINYRATYTPDIKPFYQTEFRLDFNYTFRQFQAPRTIPVEELLAAQEGGQNLFGDDAPFFDILDPPPGYFLTHFVWSGSIKRTEIAFQVQNIFNTRYRNYTDRIRYFADDLGRNFILTLTYHL